MATVGEDLIAYLVANSGVNNLVGNRVHANRVPETSKYPLIWLARGGKQRDKDLEGQGGITRHLFDLECISPQLEQSLDVADAVDSTDCLAGHRGTLGSRRVQGVFVEDQDEEYVPRGNADDEGLFVAALQVTIWST